MAHHDHRPGVLLGEEPLQPAAAVDVEVIRRLVEEQQIRRLQQQPRQPQPRQLAAGERRRGQTHLLVGEAQAVEARVNAMTDRVAARRLHACLQRRLTLHQPLQLSPSRVGHRVVDLVELPVQPVQLGERALGRVTHGLVGVERRILPEVPDPGAP